jgi:hypothetical protein
MDNSPISFNVEDTRRQLGNCSRAHVYNLIRRKQLEKRKVGGRTVILASSVARLLETPEAA